MEGIIYRRTGSEARRKETGLARSFHDVHGQEKTGRAGDEAGAAPVHRQGRDHEDDTALGEALGAAGRQQLAGVGADDCRQVGGGDEVHVHEEDVVCAGIRVAVDWRRVGFDSGSELKSVQTRGTHTDKAVMKP